MAAAKVLRIGLLTDVGILDPRLPLEFTTSSVLLQVFESPFSLPLEGRPSQPLLFAGPLEREADAAGRSVFSGLVRGGVAFSDGTPLQATHVARALEATRALVGQATVEARGERVVFTLERPNARFHLTLTQSPCGVFLERGGRLLGTGPFALDPRPPPGVLRLVRNERYLAPALLDAIEYRTYPPDAQGRPEALLRAIEAGEVDLCYVLGREDVRRLTKVRKFILPGASTCSLYFNTRSPDLSQAEVRRALAHAVDRRALAGISYSNAIAFTAQGLLPPALGAGGADDGIEHHLGRAKEILSAPGVRRPTRLRMLRVWGPRPYLPDPVRVAEHLVETFAALDIRIDIVPTRDAPEFFRLIAVGDADLFLSGWVADTPDPSEFLESLLGSRSVPSPDHIALHGNMSGYQSAAMDAALARYRAAPQEQLPEDIQRLLRTDVPLLPLQYGATILVHAWQVQNLTPSAFAWLPLGEVDLKA